MTAAGTPACPCRRTDEPCDACLATLTADAEWLSDAEEARLDATERWHYPVDLAPKD